MPKQTSVSLSEGPVFHHFAQGRWNEAGNDQAHSFFDPDANNAQDAGQVEPFEAAADGQDQQDHGGQVEGDGRPNPGHQRVMMIQSDEKVFGRDVMQVAGIEFLEDFVDQQEHVDQHGNLHDAAQGHQGAVGDEEPLGHPGPDDFVDLGVFIRSRKASAVRLRTRLGSSAMAVAMRGVAWRAETSPTCSPGPAVRVTRKRPPSSRSTTTVPRRIKKARVLGFSLAQNSVARLGLQDFRHRQNAAGRVSSARRPFREDGGRAGPSPRAWRRGVLAVQARRRAGRAGAPEEEEVTRRTTCMARMMRAGPAVKAEARKRGPTMDGIPKGPPAQPDIEKRRDGVDGDGPDDGDENKRNVKPFGRLGLPIAAVEQIAADVDVEQQVAVEHDDVPTQHGFGKIELPDAGDQMPETIRPPQVHGDKGQAHQDGRHRQEFSEDDQVMQVLVLVDINGNDHHDRRRRHADQEGEVGDIDAPGNFVAHPGDDQPVGKLPAIGVEAEQADDRQQAHPGVVTPVARKGEARATPEKNKIIANGARSYVEVVKEPRRGAHFLLELNENALALEDVGNLAVGVEDVAELARPGGADFQARRIAARARALDAEVAFLHDSLPPRAVAQIRHFGVEAVLWNRRLGEVKPPRPIGAGRFAIAAANAPIVINDGDPVGFLPGGMDRANLDARRILALLALHRHVEVTLFRHGFRRIKVVGLVNVQRAVGQLENADVLNFGIARLVVFRHAGVDAFAAADAARQIQAIDVFDAVHRFQIPHMGAQAVLLLHFVLDSFQNFVHVLRRHLLVVLLQEPLHSGEIVHFQQRLEAGGQRGQAGCQHGGSAQEAAAAHRADRRHSIFGGRWRWYVHIISAWSANRTWPQFPARDAGRARAFAMETGGNEGCGS